MTKQRLRDLSWILASAGIVLLFLAALAILSRAGEQGRRFAGPAVAPGGPALPVVTVNSPEEALQVWESRGVRGRRLLSVSRWLNFVDSDEILRVPQVTAPPVGVENLAAVARRELRTENVLYVAHRLRIVRDIVHVVPEGEFPARLEDARSEEDAVIAGGRILAPFRGMPRVIVPPSKFPLSSETSLLYVNASFFRDHVPEELLALLQRSGVRSDLVVLCLSTSDPQVTRQERERLLRFALLVSGGRG